MSKRKILHTLTVMVCAGLLSACAKTQQATTVSEASTKTKVTEAAVNAAQQAWCDGLIKIGKVYKDHGDYKGAASQFIDDAYDFKDGRVFFRPTLAVAPQAFRTTKDGTVAYFVGGDPKFPSDKGFALAPWVKCRYDNAIEGSNAIQIYGDIALAMGNVYLTGEDGKEIFVDKFFAFRQDAAGKLRLIVHKSALPNEPGK